MAALTAPSPVSLGNNRDVSTTLTYWKRLDQPLEPLDFTQPGANERLEGLSKLDESHDVTVQNIRGKETDFTLERNGFQYTKHDVKGLDGCTTEDQIRDLLLPATEELVKRVTGASKVIIHTHRIRNLATDSNKLAENRAPALSVHSDFTPAGALRQIGDHVKDPEELEKTLQKRAVAINVWRPLKQIKKDPLAVCDWTSLQVADIVPNRMIFPQFWHELGKANFSQAHKWYYLADQRPDEPLLFMQFDNKADGGMTLPHSAFVDPEFVDAAPRESIEIKLWAFFDGN